jgi:hypothetical protein
MNGLRRIVFLLTGMATLFALSCLAQPVATAASSPVAKSPVALFRELLKMSPADRTAAIAVRPPDVQKRILEKLNEYQILPPELCELRLRETELRWYLRPLMDVPRTNRTALLAQIPEDERPLVEDRLGSWDLLPSAWQDQLKDDDTIAGYFAQIESATDAERQAILDQIPADRQAELKKGIDRWAGMSEAERQKTLAGFNKIFELTPEEKEKTLDTASDQERQQMEQTLAAYGKLTPQQRAQCIQSFQKYFGMSVAERQQFLKNADRWLEMTPEERQKWRDLVSVAPIMPPMGNPPRHRIPMRTQQTTAPTMATN